MIARTKMIYKGDVLAGSFYLLLGVLAAIGSVTLYIFAERLGYLYLSKGLAALSVYMLGKGSVMMYMYWSRYRYYKIKESINQTEVTDEIEYTTYRVSKKQRNRRYYMYAILLGCFVAFAGIFHQEKGLIIGTCIPIVFLSAIEFGVGLLTEFRLSEYIRQLQR